MHQLAEPEWVAIVAHRLHRRWRSAEAAQLEEVARDLWQDDRLRALEPVCAVETWLAPLTNR